MDNNNKALIETQIAMIKERLEKANYKDFDKRSEKFLQLSQDLIAYMENKIADFMNGDKYANVETIVHGYALYTNAIRNVEAWLINLSNQLNQLKAQLKEIDKPKTNN